MREVSRSPKIGLFLLLIAVTGACSVGAPATFTLNSASVDPSYICPPDANNLPYEFHATIDARNGTSSRVTINSVDVVMTVAAVKGAWLQHVGDKYEADGLMFSPGMVDAGVTTSLRVTIPSACTSGKTPSSGASYGEYSVALTVATSSGSYKIESKNRHRIVAA